MGKQQYRGRRNKRNTNQKSSLVLTKISYNGHISIRVKTWNMVTVQKPIIGCYLVGLQSYQPIHVIHLASSYPLSKQGFYLKAVKGSDSMKYQAQIAFISVNFAYNSF